MRVLQNHKGKTTPTTVSFTSLKARNNIPTGPAQPQGPLVTQQNWLPKQVVPIWLEAQVLSCL